MIYHSENLMFSSTSTFYSADFLKNRVQTQNALITCKTTTKTLKDYSKLLSQTMGYDQLNQLVKTQLQIFYQQNRTLEIGESSLAGEPKLTKEGRVCLKNMLQQKLLHLWNTKITPQILLFLEKTDINYIYLFCCECLPDIPSVLSYFQVNLIKTLQLHSVLLDNQGLKALAKIQFLVLEELVLSETNLTGDASKLLRRFPKKEFCKFGCSKNFPSMNIVKDLGFFFGLNRKQTRKREFIHRPGKDRNNNFIYYGYFAKIDIIKEGSSSLVVVDSLSYYQRELQRNVDYVSTTMYNALQRGKAVQFKMMQSEP